jgi:hypothetical protein
MPVYFPSDAPWDAETCNPEVKMVGRISETALATQWACAAASAVAADRILMLVMILK